MAIKTKQWADGSSATIQYDGQGDGQIIITSDPNEHYEARSMQITVGTTDGSGIQKVVTVNQAAKQRIDLSAAVVTAATQTYSGSAKTPTPTVTLNGSTVPSSGYDVAYSNNTNAGTATITITGKGGYTGTATGTFTINKANPTYTAPAARSLTYSGSSQYLITTGSTSHGTIQYSANGTSWSTTRPSGTNAGSYTAYWRLVGDSNHNDVASTQISNVGIAQKALTITAKAQSISYGSSIATGTSQVTTSGLVSGDSLTAITLTASTSNVTTSGTITPSAASTTKGISNYSVTYSTGNLTITAVPASVSAAPTAKSLTYNTSAQALVNAGTANGGTMYYKYTTTNSKPTSTSEFSSSIPTRTNADTYYVWYYVKGDSNHTDTDINSTAVSVTIAKASRTLNFVNTYMVLNTSSTGTNTATPSAGSGDGAITYSIANTTYATINSSTGAVTSKTSDGSVTVTGTIAEGTNYLSASTTYKLYVFATIHNYSYTGSYKSVTLPPGTYKFEVWGAQGGSSAADSTHGITAKPGGNGGYSEGQLTLATATAVRVYVGGQGSSTAGGYNGGGSTTGSSTKDSGGTLGISKMGGGGGATDIRLSSGSLYSRMIVAGGGSGGSGACKIVSTYTTVIDSKAAGTVNPQSSYCDYQFNGILNNLVNGKTYRVTTNIQGANRLIYQSGSNWWSSYDFTFTADFTNYPPSGNNLNVRSTVTSSQSGATITIEEVTSTSETQHQYGYIGGGTNGGDGGSGQYKGKQNAAGINGSFGQGANQTTTNYRFCSAAGGGGWYGGGGGVYSDTQLYYVGLTGGGSGFVNTAASASNRPSGYTGLQLDSGTTYAGNTSFPSTGGGTETGHSGNGYARITRIS